MVWFQYGSIWIQFEKTINPIRHFWIGFWMYLESLGVLKVIAIRRSQRFKSTEFQVFGLKKNPDFVVLCCVFFPFGTPQYRSPARPRLGELGDGGGRFATRWFGEFTKHWLKIPFEFEILKIPNSQILLIIIVYFSNIWSGHFTTRPETGYHWKRTRSATFMRHGWNPNLRFTI